MGAPEVPGKSPHLSGRHQAPKLARHHRAQPGRTHLHGRSSRSRASRGRGRQAVWPRPRPAQPVV